MARLTGDVDAPLVGRVDEVALLREAVAHVASGGCRVVVLQGEPGVGKTRLLDELAVMATANGFRLLTARADEFDRRVPLAPLRLALEPPLRAEQSPRDEAAAARLLQLLNVGRGTLVDASRREPAELLSLLRQVLRSWADRAPLLVAIDDAHSADADTLETLGFLRRHVANRLLIALTARSLPPDLDVATAALIERLTGSVGDGVLNVGPLAAGDLAALIAARCGSEPGEEMVEQVRRRTLGNPFFTVELLRSFGEQDLLTTDAAGRLCLASDSGAAVPRSATILHRIVRLGPAAEAVSRTVAVLPEVAASDLGWVVELTGLGAIEVDTAIDLLVGAGVLVHSGGGFAFAHPIVRDAVYERLGPVERHRLHRSVVDLRLAQRGLDRAVDISDIARHLRLSGTADASTSHIFVAAGDAAISQAPRSAIGWYRDALAAMPINAVARGSVLSRLARALYLASRHDEAAEAAEQALALLDRGPVYERTVALQFVALQRGGRFDDALDLLDDCADDYSSLPPRLVAQRGQTLLWLDRLADAEVTLQHASALAGDERDPLVDGARLNLYAAAGRTAEAHRVAARLQATVADSQGLRRIGAVVALASAAAYNGEPLEAAGWLEQLDEQHVLPGAIDAARVYERFTAGAWDDAIELAEHSLVDGEGDAALRPLLLAAMVHILAERGELSAALPMCERISDAPVFRGIVLTACAHVHQMAGDVDRARAEASRAFRHQLRIGRVGNIAESALVLVDVEVACDRRDAARAVADQLVARLPPEPNARERVLTGIATAVAHRDAAAARAAATIAAARGLVFEQARGLVLAGDLLDDADAVVESLHIFRRLRVPDREREAARVLRRLGRRVPRARRSGGGLTASERRLAELVGHGLTNRQIAAELHLSPKTIEVYLTRLYAKVGCRSRIDLAVAVRSGHV